MNPTHFSPVVTTLALLAFATPSAGELEEITSSLFDVVPPASGPGVLHYFAGAAWADVDGDDWPDLFVTDYYGINRLYLNVPAPPLAPGPSRMLMFVPFAIDGDPLGKGEGAVFADFDNDGDPDLYVTNQGGSPNHLYENSGGIFVDVSGTSGAAHPGMGEGCTVADYDGDGLLDLFVTNYGSPDLPFNPGEPNVLYKNLGGLLFADVTAAAGIPLAPARSSACSFVDFDLDGDPDLFVANEGAANQLLENEGGVFTDVTLAVGGPDLVDADGGAFGARWVDTDIDGDLDLYISNASTTYATDATNKFFLRSGIGDGTLLTLADFGGASDEYGMGVTCGDLDLDGDQDVALANFGGNQVYLSSIGTGYGEAPPAWLDEAAVDMSSSATRCDFDRDGDLDVFFGGLGGVIAYEYEPHPAATPGRRGIAVRFHGDATPPHAIPADAAGTVARARIRQDAIIGPSYSIHERPAEIVDGGSGYSQDAPELLWGANVPGGHLHDLEVTWPGGVHETLFALPEELGSLRQEIDVQYPAGIESYGDPADPTPLELWRSGTGTTLPDPSLGETEFALAARGFEDGAALFLAWGFTELALPFTGGSLLVLPQGLLLGTAAGETVTWPVPLPPSAALEGVVLRFQALGIGAAGFDWSNGVAVTLQP